MKLLLVEDQKYMAYAIEEILRKHKYVVDLAFDGEVAVDYISKCEYDVIVLDIMLPKINGFEIMKIIRDKRISTPVIMLTAKSDIEDKVKGLDLGADDYLSKPFETVELLARIRAITRRGTVIEDANILCVNNLTFNLDTLDISDGSNKFTLTAKEAKLLEMFLKKPNVIIAKETIINKLWSFDQVVIDNNVEVYISFLRKKLDALDTSVSIKTVRGIGYKLMGDGNV